MLQAFQLGGGGEGVGEEENFFLSSDSLHKYVDLCQM